jgi:hypothetical protein
LGNGLLFHRILNKALQPTCGKYEVLNKIV